MRVRPGIRAKLLALIALPFVVTAVMATIVVSAATRTADRATNVHEATVVVRAIDAAVDELQAERALTYRAGQDRTIVGVLLRQRSVTDQKLAALHALTQGSEQWPDAKDDLDRVTAAHAGLPLQRQNWDSRTLSGEVLEEYYTRLVRADLVLSRLIVAGSTDDEISRSLRSYASIANFVEAASLERDITGKAFRIDSIPGTVYRQVAGLAAEQDTNLVDFRSVASRSQLERLTAAIDSIDINEVSNLRLRLDTVFNGTRPGDAAAWEAAASSRIEPFEGIRRSVLDDIQNIARTSAARARRQVATVTGLSLAAAAIILLLVVALSRSITGPLKKTAEVLHDVAEGDLTSRLHLKSTDELGRMADSLNITLERLAERSAALTIANVELRSVEHELRTLVEGSPDAIAKLDRDFRHVYVNPKAAELLGLAQSEIVGRTNREIATPPGNYDLWESTLRGVLDSGVPAEHESSHEGEGIKIFLHSRLAPLFSSEGEVTGVLVASRDLTDRKLAEEALAHQAVHDPVTGLANRVLLLDRVEQALRRLERRRGVVAVLFLDLDRFKVVNDSLGHSAGDELLQEVARRLERTTRRGDTVARFGGDEFVVLCDGLPSQDLIRVLARRIGRALAEPFVVGGREVTVGSSIGIATTSDSSRTADDLVRDADAAMYQAKERGRGRFEFFDAEVRERANSRLDIEAGLRQALERGEFQVVYQPLVSLTDRSVTGFEALVRWLHPERGAVLPADFIPVAEETKLIVPIDRWVLDEACRQLVEWNAHRGARPPLTMAVNISGRQLSEPDVVEAVVAVLGKHDVDPSLLCLEITETAMLQDAALAERVFERLAAIGVQLALDDFGTGYSSLGHLQRFPVNILKIDRSFVQRMNAGDDGEAIIVAVTGMARALGMRTVGEGIESVEQLARLTRLGCDVGQGYLLGRPAAAADLRPALDIGSDASEASDAPCADQPITATG